MDGAIQLVEVLLHAPCQCEEPLDTHKFQFKALDGDQSRVITDTDGETFLLSFQVVKSSIHQNSRLLNPSSHPFCLEHLSLIPFVHT